MKSYDEAVQMLNGLTGENRGLTRMAYDEPDAIAHPLLVSDQDLVSGPGPAAAPAVKEHTLCGHALFEQALIAEVFAVKIPESIDPDFIYYKPVQQCGDLYPIYLAYRAMLLEKGKEVSVTLHGTPHELKVSGGGVVLQDNIRGLVFGSENTEGMDWGSATDVLIWVNSDWGCEGYIYNGWVYMNKDKQIEE